MIRPPTGHDTLVQFHAGSVSCQTLGPRSSLNRGMVFLIDDDAPVRRALERLIRAAGYDVTSLADGPAYLALPAPSPPACLVLDIRMPGMTGLDLQAAVYGTLRALPIVFITGHGDQDVRAPALATGAVVVLFRT